MLKGNLVYGTFKILILLLLLTSNISYFYINTILEDRLIMHEMGFKAVPSPFFNTYKLRFNTVRTPLTWPA